LAIDLPKLFFMQTSQSIAKEERLRSYKLIQKLFSEGRSFFEYPFKVVFIEIDPTGKMPARFPVQCLFSVSKRNFKKAVDRNKIKRLTREAYRMNKLPLYENLRIHDKNVALALVYTGKQIPKFTGLEAKIINIIKRLIQEFNSKKDRSQTKTIL
jgi:ribonuclease P protein component